MTVGTPVSRQSRICCISLSKPGCSKSPSCNDDTAIHTHAIHMSMTWVWYILIFSKRTTRRPCLYRWSTSRQISFGTSRGRLAEDTLVRPWTNTIKKRTFQSKLLMQNKVLRSTIKVTSTRAQSTTHNINQLSSIDASDWLKHSTEIVQWAAKTGLLIAARHRNLKAIKVTITYESKPNCSVTNTMNTRCKVHNLLWHSNAKWRQITYEEVLATFKMQNEDVLDTIPATAQSCDTVLVHIHLKVEFHMFAWYTHKRPHTILWSK